jgi:prepilin-type N-terminal cleavage/methylation domain-containing protein/prepilin-type processing-associated H-X9-DG protein
MRAHRGFTLVELLVVVVIIGLLVGLTVPAVQSARESARRVKCTNYQRELGLAVLHYEHAKERFPGYLNPNNLSWVVAVFPYLGRNDLWEEWRGGKGPEVRLDQLVCPDDSARQQLAALSYVASAKLFLDRSAGLTSKSVSLCDVKAPGRTVLLSERLGAGPWTASGDPQKDVQQLAFQWITVCEPGGVHCVTSPLVSSNHPGGVLATFCDGHVDFMPSETQWNDYPPGP